MIVVLIVSVVVLIGVLAALVLGRTGSMSVAMADPASNVGGIGLPAERAVTAEDISALRFDRAVRGYRMEQVDEVLDRLRDELAERDRELAELSAGGGSGVPLGATAEDRADLSVHEAPATAEPATRAPVATD